MQIYFIKDKKYHLSKMEIIDDSKIILKYLKNYKRPSLRALVFAVIFSVLSAITPYVYGRLVDLVNSVPSPSFTIFALLGIWTLTTILSLLFRRMVSLRGGFISIDIFCDFIYEEASHIMNLPLGFHREKKVGELLSRISRASESLRSIIDNIVFWILPQFFSVFVGVVILLFVNWQLSLGAFVVFFLSVLITIYKTSSILRAQNELNKKLDKAFGRLNDSLLNIQTIKSCAAEDFQGERINNVYRKEVAPVFKKVFVAWENATLSQELIFSLGFVGIFGYAIYLMGKNVISTGVLVMFIGYLNLINTPLKSLLWQWLSFQRGMTSIKRARKLLLLKEENYNKDGIVLERVKGKVEFKNVYFRYSRKNYILKDISFLALPGQKIAIVGGSGEGKTTLVDLISLYFTPTKGKIFIDDVEIRKFNLSFLRKIIASVPQEILLFNSTIKDNILYGKPDASNEEVIKAAKAAHIHNFIESLPKKYNTLVGERGIKLSGGQKQRISIARALIRDPKILILDEATSSLDSESERLVQEALDELIRGRTTFIVAHRLSTIRNADKILVLEKGKIVEEGTHNELIKKKGVYWRFYSLQFKVKKDS